MSKTEMFKNQIKNSKEKPSALGNYLGETIEGNNNDKDKDAVIHDDNSNEENKISDKTYVNDNNVVDDNEAYIKKLLSGEKINKKKRKKVFTSFYLEPDLHDEIEKIVKKGVKGDKSLLINTAIRRYLKDAGVID